MAQIDRVEVLRGPQGTLFGRNTSAGLISIITAKPRFQTSVYGQLDVGNYDLRRLELGVTGPLSDTIAARARRRLHEARRLHRRCRSPADDVNDRDRWLLRGQLLFQPSDDLSFRLIGDYAKRDEECCAAPYLPAQRLHRRGGRAAINDQAARCRRLGGIINDDPFDRNISITPGRSYQSRRQGLTACRANSSMISAAPS